MSATCCSGSATRRIPSSRSVEGEVAILDRGRERDRPPRRLRLPRRAEPPVRPDRLPDRGRDRAAALHRGRPRRAARAPVRGRPAQRPGPARPSSPGGRRCRRVQGIGIEIVGPRSSEADDALLDFARANRLPFTLAGRGAAPAGSEPPLVRLPGGGELQHPSRGEVLRALGIGRELAAARKSTCSSSAPAPPGSPPPSTAPPKDSTRSSSRARPSAARPARPAGSRTTSASRPGSAAAELTSRAVTQARKFGARPATPVPRGLPRAGRRPPPRATRGGARDRSDAPSCSRPAPSTGGSRSTDLSDYEGTSVFYAAGPTRGPALRRRSRVAVVGGGNSAGQAAVWLARGGALVTLLHRRADLRETMSDYLIRELERYGVAVRDRSEIAALHGNDGQPRGGHAHRRRAAAVLVPLPLPRRATVHGVARRRRRTRTPTASSSPATPPAPTNLLETSVPGIFAAGDVRSGSTKRCAAAVGEGSMAVQFVHEHLSAQPALSAVSDALHPSRPGRPARAPGRGRGLRGLPARRAASGCTCGSASRCGHVGCCDELPEPPRDRAPPRDLASDHPLARAGRGLELVLLRRGRVRPRRPSRHDTHPALTAPELILPRREARDPGLVHCVPVQAPLLELARLVAVERVSVDLPPPTASAAPSRS